MAYDLVASEYGWSDEAIGDLLLVRLRQITSAIQTRKFLTFREENARFSWMTRQLSLYIANGYMTESKENPAADAAQKIGYDDIEIASLTGQRPPKPGEAAMNGNGSFERLMGFSHGMSRPD